MKRVEIKMTLFWIKLIAIWIVGLCIYLFLLGVKLSRIPLTPFRDYDDDDDDDPEPEPEKPEPPKEKMIKTIDNGEITKETETAEKAK